MSDQLAVGREIHRKAIHLVTTIIPLAYISILPKKEHIFIVCVSMTIGFLSADLLRIFSKTAERYFLKIFSMLLREGEINHQLTGATYLFIGLTLAVFLFPKEIAIVVMMFLTIADPVAAITGKTFPVKKIFNKSVGGFLAFFLCAVIIISIQSGFTFIGLIVAIIAAVVELLPVRINDNITIPVVSGYMFILLR